MTRGMTRAEIHQGSNSAVLVPNWNLPEKKTVIAELGESQP